MTDTYDFKPETIKIIMAGLKPETRLNQSGKQQVYMVPLDNVSEEQIKEAAQALKGLVETSLYMQGKKYNNDMPAVEAFNAMGQPTMYRGTDAEAIRMIDNIADVMQEEQTKQDMDIIRSVYTPVINGDNIQFKMLERYQVNRENIERAVKLLDHHFGVKINDPQEKVPLMAKAYRHTELDVPAEYAKYAIQMMSAQENKEEQTETKEKEDKPQLITPEREQELNKAYEEWQAKRAEQIKQVAIAYDVARTERDGTYFRPKEGATSEELAAGEQALRTLTDEKMKDKRFYIPNAIISMGAMNGPKMFRATNQKIDDTEKVKEIFAEIGEEVKSVVLPQTQEQEKTQEEPETIDMPDLTNTISEPAEAEPIVQQITPQSHETKMPATNEQKAIKYALQTAADLEKNFIVVAGNLEARPWVLPEQIETIKKQVAPLLETKDIIKDGRVIGLEPTNPDQADAIFQMMEAAKATRTILDTYPQMAKNPQDVLKLFADNLETIQKTAEENKKADNTVETPAAQPTEEVINGTIVNRTLEPELLADLNDDRTAEPAQTEEELSYIPPARMAEMYAELSKAEPTPETERQKEAIGKRMDKFIADYVAGEIVINQDNIADTYDDMKKVLDLYGPEDKNASVARERLEKEIALYDKNNHLEDITPADETYLTNRLEAVKEALKGVELDTYYTNLRFFDNDKKEVPQLNENGEIRADSELAKLLNIVKSDILTEQTLATGSVDPENIAKRANELLQVNTVALMAADLKRTGEDPTTAPERLEALKNGQTFMIPQGTMAGFTATNVNEQVARLNRLGTKLNNKSGVVQQLYEPLKTVDPLSAERFGKQPQKTNLLKTCLKKFGLGSMAGALASGAGLGAMAWTLPAVPVVAGVMAAYTAGHMWIQRKREVDQAKKEGKEPSSLKNFFKKNTVRALLTGASLGAIAMGLPAVALGIGAAAAAVGFKGIFKRNRQEGYDVKTSILRSVPESVAGIAGAMLTGGLIHGVAMDSAGHEQAVAETTETTAETAQTTAETVQTAAEQTPVNPTPTGTDTAPTGTDTDTGTETTDSGETGTPTTPTVEEAVQQPTEEQTPVHETITLEEVAQAPAPEEVVIDQPITLGEHTAETPAFDMTEDTPITLSGQEIAGEPIDLNSTTPITMTEDMIQDTLANQTTSTVEQPVVGTSNITPEQQEALLNDDFAEELNVIDKIEQLAREQGIEVPPREVADGPNFDHFEFLENFLKKPGNEELAAEYEEYISYNPLLPVENIQDPSAIATNEPTVEVDPDTGTTYVHMEGTTYASGHDMSTTEVNVQPTAEGAQEPETYEEAVPMSETSNDPAMTYGIGTQQTVNYDIQVQTAVLEDTPVHHTYETSAHELAQARLNGEGIYDAAGRPTTPDYTPEQLDNALNQIRSLEGTHPELTGTGGTSNADILMYKLTQFNKLIAGNSELDINGTHIEINDSYGVQLDNGQIYTPAKLQADLLAGNTPPISADQTAEMLGKVELSISSKGHFNQDIAHFQESGRWSYKPGMDAGFTVEPVVKEGPTVDLSQISMPEIEIPDPIIDVNVEPQPVELGEMNIPDLSEGLQPAEHINLFGGIGLDGATEETPVDEIGLDGAIEETPVDKINQEEIRQDEAKPFVPFTPYEKNEDSEEKHTPETPVATIMTPETPEVGTPAATTPTPQTPEVGTPADATPAPETPEVGTPAGITPSPEMPEVGTPAATTSAPETPEVGTPAATTPAPQTPEVGTPTGITPTPEMPEVGNTPETPMGVHFNFGDAVQTPAMADSDFVIPNSTDNVFTFDMSKPENNAKYMRPDKEPAQPIEPSQEQLLGQYNDLRIELAKLEQQLIAMGVVLTPEAGQAPQPKEEGNTPPLPEKGGKEIIFTGPQLEGKEAVAIGNQGIAGLIVGRKTVTFKRNGSTKKGKANGDTFSIIDENGNIIGRTHSGNEVQKGYDKYYTPETAAKNKEMRKFLKEAEEKGDVVQMEIFAIQLEGRKCLAYIDGTGQPIGREQSKGAWEKALENTKNISNDDKTIATPIEQTTEEAVAVPPVVPQVQEETVATPIVPPMQEETAEVPAAPALTEAEQKAVEAIVNPEATSSGVEAEIQKDMLKSAGIETAPKKSVRETLMGIAKLNLLNNGKEKASANTVKKEPQDKQPFFNGLFKKRGQGK
ncbi:MAG: hypothetical protein IKL32_05385 [Alphaproteobacteria bacterium]|nr:hypothetical protein [Alphaproteobacteria bacterium]